MKIEVKTRGTVKELDMNIPFTGEELLKKLHFSPDAVIILVDGRPVPCTEPIESTSVHLIQVASGG